MSMKSIVIAGLLGAALSSVQAAAPVGVSCTAEVTGCAYALDGVFPVEWQEWTSETAYWDGTAAAVTYDLGGSRQITGVTVSLDNNDSYLLEASADGGASWNTLLFVGASVGNVDWGMDTFSTLPAHPHYDAGISFTPQTGALIRVMAVDGDGLYSVGELQFTTAVPEPASWAMALAGVAGLAAWRRRSGR